MCNYVNLLEDCFPSYGGKEHSEASIQTAACGGPKQVDIS